MLDTKDKQCKVQQNCIEKKCAKKLGKNEEQCEVKIVRIEKTHYREVGRLQRRMERLKSKLKGKSITIKALYKDKKALEVWPTRHGAKQLKQSHETIDS